MAIQAPNLSNEKESGVRDLTYRSLLELFHLLIERELEKGFNLTKKIPRENLIDYRNDINFSEKEISIVFRHPKYNKIVTRENKTEPCQEEIISGRWVKPEDFSEFQKDFEVLCFLIENRREIISSQSQRVKISDQGLDLTLPKNGLISNIQSKSF